MKRLIFIILVSFLVMNRVWADNCGNDVACLGKQIEELSKEVSIRSEANERNATEMRSLQAKVAGLQNQVKGAEKELVILEDGLKTREEKVSVQYEVFSVKTREFYKKLRNRSILAMIFAEAGGEKNRDLIYRSDANDQDRQIILNISREIIDIEDKKNSLEKQKEYLFGLSGQLDKQAKFLEGEVAGVNKYISSLEGKIAALSARQQAILSEKAGTFQTTVGDVPLADDPNSRPDYNPGFSPAFAAFSFGAPHFKGMSQYGAFGRAKSGQNVETILHAYYGDVEIKKDYDPGKQIGVDGYGRMEIETYVKRVYEVPESWGSDGGFEALKAQAVAARSYALAWTREGNGGAICTTQRCQVYKNVDKGGRWNEAVEATRGWVMYKNGKIVSAWYASTSGGYQESYNALAYLRDGSGFNTPAFWDTPRGKDGWTSEAYEKTAGSPWFYKGWYKSRSGDSCGRSHPWLTSEEMADILNAWVVLYQGGGDSGRVTPESSCWGGNPYSKGELQGVGGYTSVSGASVQYATNGVTASVTFQTNKGSKPIDGAEFKKAFNLRAPGRIALKSGLFNIEVK